MGIAFIIPLRKHMIDYVQLTYPGGVAVATILKSTGAGVRTAVILLIAALLSACVHLATIKTGVSNGNIDSLLGMPGYMNGIWYLSLMTIGAGFIGGFVAYWFLSPMLAATGSFPLDAAGESINSPGPLRLLLFRPLGIGMLIGGDVPAQKYAAGAILGGVLSAVMGGLGIIVGLGFYLPFNIVLTYSLGTLARELTDRMKGTTWSEEYGIPIAAGLIVGDALRIVMTS